MAFWEKSIRSSKKIEKQGKKDFSKLKSLESKANNIRNRLERSKRLNNENKAKALDKAYVDIELLIETYGEEFKLFMEISHEEAILVHRLLGSFHELDATMKEFEDAGVEGEKFNELKAELSKEEETIARQLRTEGQRAGYLSKTRS